MDWFNLEAVERKFPGAEQKTIQNLNDQSLKSLITLFY